MFAPFPPQVLARVWTPLEIGTDRGRLEGEVSQASSRFTQTSTSDLALVERFEPTERGMTNHLIG
jgi:hypothetical protein